MELYKNMLKEHKSKNITIIGDSAGATLSLVLGQNIKNSHCEKPNNIIAISPAVDLSIKYDANDKNQIKDDVISPAMITAAKE
ncbi:hypothetical protein FACS189459_5040 [Bacilli bacterium]|nr:hypothetical protein FACS189459_5040 [Bacilli bacterium]